MLGSHGFTCCLDTPGWTWTNPEKPEKTGQAPSNPAAALPWGGSSRRSPRCSHALQPASLTGTQLGHPILCHRCKASAGTHGNKKEGQLWLLLPSSLEGKHLAKSNCTGSASGYCLFVSLSFPHKHTFIEFFDQIRSATEGKMPVLNQNYQKKIKSTSAIAPVCIYTQ